MKRIKSIIKGIDAYGTPVSLTYKNSTSFKSVLGGTATIMGKLCALVYFLVKLMAVFKRDITMENSSW
jgi:hypothetical protein